MGSDMGVNTITVILNGLVRKKKNFLHTFNMSQHQCKNVHFKMA